MKNIFVVILCLFTLNNFAQIKVNFNNSGQFYVNVVENGFKKVLTSPELINQKSLAIPFNFPDTLKKYYWVELCSYHYTDKTYHTSFNEKIKEWHVQLDFREFDKDGILVQYQISRSAKDTTIYTTTFDKSTSSKIVAVKNINNSDYIILEAYGEKENHRLVRFSDGILIQDISMNGKIGEKANYRIAYMAIAKP